MAEKNIPDCVGFSFADVAVSDDLTGQKELGGDWYLEYQSGHIETTIAFSGEVRGTWAGLLVTPDITARETVDNDTDGQIDHIRTTTDQNLDDDFSYG